MAGFALTGFGVFGHGEFGESPCDHLDFRSGHPYHDILRGSAAGSGGSAAPQAALSPNKDSPQSAVPQGPGRATSLPPCPCRWRLGPLEPPPEGPWTQGELRASTPG